MAFQISDDLLDLLGTEKQIGKPPGSDIKQGNITLPVLLALQEASIKEELLTEIKKIQESNGARDTKKALNLIRKSAGIPVAEEMAIRLYQQSYPGSKRLAEYSSQEEFDRHCSFHSKKELLMNPSRR